MQRKRRSKKREKEARRGRTLLILILSFRLCYSILRRPFFSLTLFFFFLKFCWSAQLSPNVLRRDFAIESGLRGEWGGSGWGEY
jgi:hypothetical protein